MGDKSTISQIFNQTRAQFVPLPAGIKSPPTEKGWQNKDHNFEEAENHVRKGGNVGILAGNGYIGLDQDDPKAFAGLELVKTTLWETRPGRLGSWFRCLDCSLEVLAKYDFKPDQTQIKLSKDGRPVGEIKLGRAYQVIPPSWKKVDGLRVDYKMLDDVPPAEISLDWLLSELLKIGITFSKKPKTTRKKQIVIKQIQADKDRDRRYAEAALENEVNTLARTPEGNRNNQLNKSTFVLGQLVSSGLLDESRAVEELSSIAHDMGLDPDEIDRTIKSGLEEGKKNPRELPDLQDWRETVKQAITHLAHCCDGAHAKDGVGFNKYDSEFCKDLASRIIEGQDISDRELKAALRKVQKYKKPLASAGISLPSAISECNTKESMATLIVKQITENGAELWHSEDKKAYITFEREGHRENHPLRSSNSKGWLAKLGYEIYSKAPGKQAIEDASNVLEGMAIFEGPEHPAYIRLAHYGDKVYVDLGTPDWSMIEISAQGWQITSDPLVRFRRPKTLKPLLIPERGGSWEDLREL